MMNQRSKQWSEDEKIRVPPYSECRSPLNLWLGATAAVGHGDRDRGSQDGRRLECSTVTCCGPNERGQDVRRQEH